jgi:hypothetical protein
LEGIYPARDKSMVSCCQLGNERLGPIAAQGELFIRTGSGTDPQYYVYPKVIVIKFYNYGIEKLNEDGSMN